MTARAGAVGNGAIDVHSHVIPPEVVAAMEADPTALMARIEETGSGRVVRHDQGYVYPLLDEFVDPVVKLRVMDDKRLAVSVVSPPPPLFFYWLDPRLGIETARLVNDGIAAMVAVAPDRPRGVATIPMADPEAAIAEIDRVVETHGFRAIEVGTSIEGEQLAAPRFRPVPRRALELGVLVLAHPYYVGSKAGLEDYYLTNLVGNPLDTTVMVAHLMFSGALDELDALDLCVAHGGGYAPYALGRLQHGHRVREEPRRYTSSSPRALLRRLRFDTITFSAPALGYLVDRVGADRLLLGSGAPFDMAMTIRSRRSTRSRGSANATAPPSCAATPSGCSARRIRPASPSFGIVLGAGGGRPIRCRIQPVAAIAI